MSRTEPPTRVVITPSGPSTHAERRSNGTEGEGETPKATSAFRATFFAVERALEEVIRALASGKSTRARRELGVEAKRLRRIVASWHAFPPRFDLHADMLRRVRAIALAAGISPEDMHLTAVESYPEIRTEEVEWGGIDDEASAELWYAGERAHDEPTTERNPLLPAAAESARGDDDEATSEAIVYGEPVDPSHFDGRGRAVPAYVVGEVIVSEQPPLDTRRPDDVERSRRPPTPINEIMCGLREPFDARLILLREPRSDRADAFRSLARKVASICDPKVIAVTSPGRSEGKTCVAANIALALHEGGRRRVLLVEANPRTPCLAKLFGFELSKDGEGASRCFVEQLAEHADDPTAPWSVAEPIQGFHVLGMDAKSAPRGGLDVETFSSGLESLKHADYDSIVIDTEAVLGDAFVNLVVDHADGVLLAARRVGTTRRALRRAAEQLSPATILAIVLLEAQGGV